MFRQSGGWLTFVMLLGVAQAAGPAWLRDALTADVSVWKDTSSIVVLHESLRAEYLGRDRVRRRIRGAIRIMREAGRDEARARVVYNADTASIRSAKAWIVSANGRTTDAYNRGQWLDTLAEFDDHMWDAWREFSFGGSDRLSVGSVLAWEVELDVPSGLFDSRWFFASRQPVAESVFEVAPLAGTRLAWHATSTQVPSPVSGDTPGSLRWVMRRIEPLPPELPTAFDANMLSVSVRCVEAAAPAAQVLAWPELTRQVVPIIETRVVAAPEVKALAEKLTQGRSERWARVRAITEFVQRDVPYLAVTLDRDSLAGYRPHLPAEVLKRRLGDCKDKATLVVAMLRSLGERAHVVLVYAGNPRAISADWPTAEFNHTIVGIAADETIPSHWPTVEVNGVGRLVLFDATDPETPLGFLPPWDQGSVGLVVANGASAVPMPVVAPADNSFVREVSATLAGTGDLRATVTESHRGTSAVGLHQARTNDRAEAFTRLLEKRLGRTVTQAAGLEWKDEWSAADTTYQLTWSFNATRYGRSVGREMMLVCPRVMSDIEPLTAWKVTQEGWSWIPPRQMHNRVRLELPEGFTIDDVPAKWSCDLPVLTAKLDYRVDGREVIFESDVILRGGVLGKAEYEASRVALQKYNDAERRPIVLKRPKPPSV